MKPALTTPKALILGVMQAAREGAMSVKTLISIGDLFGFTDNTIRVTATRLLSEGKLESSERGMYRVNMKKNPFSRFLDSWRLGEERLTAWDGSWLCYMVPPVPVRRQVKFRRNLLRPGLREGAVNLWVRPNNLSIGLQGVKKIVDHFILEDRGVMFVGCDFEEAMIEKWKQSLWPTDEIIAAQKEGHVRLQQSAEALFKMPVEKALVESFLLGSEAIHLLISDPLLPPELMDHRYRIKLTKALLDYDLQGKQIWSECFGAAGIEKSPQYVV